MAFDNPTDTGYFKMSPDDPNAQPLHPSKGYVEGMLARHADDRAERADRRAEDTQMMAHTEFENGQEDRANKTTMQAGMAQAGKTGGYSGVIDYLKTMDPEKAMAFESAKTGLDNQILKNNILQATIPSMQAKAMTESYTALGRMGFAVNNAPDADKDGMYQRMLPMIKTVVPDAPDSYNQDAKHIFLLATAQATPANILYKNTQDKVTSESAMGKLSTDIRSRLQAGVDASSPELQTMIKAYNAYGSKADEANNNLQDQEYGRLIKQAQATKDQSQATAAKYGLTSKMNKDLQSESKGYNDFKQQYAKFTGSLDAALNGGATAQEAAAQSLAPLLRKGKLSDKMISNLGNSDSVLDGALKKVNSYAGAGRIAFTPQEIQRMKVVGDSVNQSMQKEQNGIVQKYLGLANKAGVDPIDLGIQLPQNKPQYTLQQIQQIAQKAITPKEKGGMGKSPQAVQKLVESLSSQISDQKPTNQTTNAATASATAPQQPGAAYAPDNGGDDGQ